MFGGSGMNQKYLDLEWKAKEVSLAGQKRDVNGTGGDLMISH